VVLILASTGIRIGALHSIRIHDLERFGDLYKITIYAGEDNDEYYTFCTPEATKEIDRYLDFRKRHGEKITGDSFLLVKQFNVNSKHFTGEQYGKQSLRIISEDHIRNSGLREIDHDNPHKRKEVPIFHGFRKFFSSQLVKADVKTEYKWLLEGHSLKANDKSYVKISENPKDLLKEYLKAVDNLTINEENRLRKKVEKLEGDKSQLEILARDVAILKSKMKKR
jgi:integrase